MNTPEVLSQNNSLSFGRHLRTIRLEKGISLKEIARDTRIGMDTLLFIEKEDHGRLPAEVFMKGFLRAYAKAIGADGDAVVQRYLLSLGAYQETAQFEADLVRSSTKFWPRLLLSLAMLGCIIMTSVHLLPFSRETKSTSDQEKQQYAAENASVTDSEKPSGPVPEEQPKKISEKLLLKVLAVKVAWMKVVIDGQNSQEYQLKPGDHLELEATTGFNLLIGDAKGIILTLDDKPQPVPGKDGQVVTVQIP